MDFDDYYQQEVLNILVNPIMLLSLKYIAVTIK